MSQALGHAPGCWDVSLLFADLLHWDDLLDMDLIPELILGCNAACAHSTAPGGGRGKPAGSAAVLPPHDPLATESERQPLPSPPQVELACSARSSPENASQDANAASMPAAPCDTVAAEPAVANSEVAQQAGDGAAPPQSMGAAVVLRHSVGLQSTVAAPLVTAHVTAQRSSPVGLHDAQHLRPHAPRAEAPSAEAAAAPADVRGHVLQGSLSAHAGLSPRLACHEHEVDRHPCDSARDVDTQQPGHAEANVCSAAAAVQQAVDSLPEVTCPQHASPYRAGSEQRELPAQASEEGERGKVQNSPQHAGSPVAPPAAEGQQADMAEQPHVCDLDMQDADEVAGSDTQHSTDEHASLDCSAGDEAPSCSPIAAADVQPAEAAQAHACLRPLLCGGNLRSRRPPEANKVALDKVPSLGSDDEVNLHSRRPPEASEVAFDQVPSLGSEDEAVLTQWQRSEAVAALAQVTAAPDAEAGAGPAPAEFAPEDEGRRDAAGAQAWRCRLCSATKTKRNCHHADFGRHTICCSCSIRISRWADKHRPASHDALPAAQPGTSGARAQDRSGYGACTDASAQAVSAQSSDTMHQSEAGAGHAQQRKCATASNRVRWSTAHEQPPAKKARYGAARPLVRVVHGLHCSTDPGLRWSARSGLRAQ
jgi:hypothetical protein